MRIIILGGTGFIGAALARRLLGEGHEVVVPSRSPEKVARVFGDAVSAAPFDGETGAGWAEFIGPDAAVVNLAGENIAGGRWTPERRRRISGSRLAAGAAVLDALRRASAAPCALVQASAVGYYGSRGPNPLGEEAPPGGGFLAEVARNWEESTRPAETLGVRRVVIRTGMVLGRGGALAKMLPAFRLGLGGPLGSGRQPVPWIHLDDEVGAIMHLIASPRCSGPYNLVAPEAVDSRGFARALGRVLRRPARLPAPAFALRLLFGRMADEILLTGAGASCARLLATGYGFRHPALAGALEAALRQG